MVLAYLAASLAKHGGRPPSPRSAMALMAALLAAQIGWTVGKHQTGIGKNQTLSVAGGRSVERVVDDGGFSLAFGVRREAGAAEGGASGVTRPKKGAPRPSGDGFESWWLGELDDSARKGPR